MQWSLVNAESLSVLFLHAVIIEVFAA